MRFNPARGGHPVNVAHGEAAAWSPNPMNPPLFFDQPVKNMNSSLQSRRNGWPIPPLAALLDQFVPNMKKYSGVAMDIGLQDTLSTPTKS